MKLVLGFMRYALLLALASSVSRAYVSNNGGGASIPGEPEFMRAAQTAISCGYGNEKRFRNLMKEKRFRNLMAECAKNKDALKCFFFKLLGDIRAGCLETDVSPAALEAYYGLESLDPSDVPRLAVFHRRWMTIYRRDDCINRFTERSCLQEIQECVSRRLKAGVQLACTALSNNVGNEYLEPYVAGEGSVSIGEGGVAVNGAASFSAESIACGEGALSVGVGAVALGPGALAAGPRVCAIGESAVGIGGQNLFLDNLEWAINQYCADLPERDREKIRENCS